MHKAVNASSRYQTKSQTKWRNVRRMALSRFPGTDRRSKHSNLATAWVRRLATGPRSARFGHLTAGVSALVAAWCQSAWLLPFPLCPLFDPLPDVGVRVPSSNLCPSRSSSGTGALESSSPPSLIVPISGIGDRESISDPALRSSSKASTSFVWGP